MEYECEVLMQLFVQGPTWDGNLVSKQERDFLVKEGLVERWNGWNYLNQKGIECAVAEGMKAKDWYDKRWYKKASLQ